MKNSSAFCAVLLAFVFAAAAQAADLDWGGQFRFENHWVNNYGMGGVVERNATLEDADGYYIPYAGQKKAQFQTLFLKLQPKLVVNDNVAIKSEWWLGNPSTNFFGSAGTGGNGQAGNYYNSNGSAGSTITAQRFWADILSDFGTVSVGRAPFHWGLGLVHHSGDGLWDRFETTGNTVRLNAKIGNFLFTPATTKYSTGEVVGGTWNTGNADFSSPGGEALYEFSMGLQYKNLDEDLEGGVNLVRRMAGAQGSTKWINDQTGSLNYSIWDIYAKKKLGRFDFALEAPIYNGKVLGTPYKAFALAGELNYHPNDAWLFGLKAGKVPGQGSSTNQGTTKWNMVYLNPNYKLGLIMFNYQLRNFAGVRRTAPPAQTAASGDSTYSVFDNPITNANYLNLGGAYRTDKWTFGLQFVTATADETAEEGKNFFNQWYRSYSDQTAVKSQGSSYGKEVDLSVAMDWDEFTMIGLDWGWYFPGNFYAFTNTAQDSPTSNVMAIVGRIGVRF